MKRKKTKLKRQKSNIVTLPGRRVATFPEVNGKVIESVEASEDDGECYITININDSTKLTLIVVADEPQFSIEADYGNWKTGNFQAIKRWGRLEI